MEATGTSNINRATAGPQIILTSGESQPEGEYEIY